MPKEANEGSSYLASVEGAHRSEKGQSTGSVSCHHLPCTEHLPGAREERGKGKRRPLLPLRGADPQAQGPILAMTTEAREPEWTESNPNLLLYRVCIPSQPCPTGRQCGRQGPIRERWSLLHPHGNSQKHFQNNPASASGRCSSSLSRGPGFWSSPWMEE